jgi:hypothetical protein
MRDQSAFLVMLRRIAGFQFRRSREVCLHILFRPVQNASRLKVIAKCLGIFPILFTIFFADLGTCSGNG